MVLVKYLLGMPEVKIVVRTLAPRKVKHELYIIILYAVVRRARVISLELCHLLLENFLHGGRP